MSYSTPFMMQAAAEDDAISYPATVVRSLIDALVPLEGVIGDDALKVSVRGAGANMSVDVAAGSCFILGDSAVGQGKYLCVSTSVVNKSIAAAPESGTRVHRVVARLRDKQYDNGDDYDWLIDVQEDTGSGTPALEDSMLKLAEVTVKAGDGAVQASAIKDVRPFATGLPAQVAQFEFYGGDQSLASKATTLYKPDGVQNYRGVTVPNANEAKVVTLRRMRILLTGCARIAGSGPGTNSERAIKFVQKRGGTVVRQSGNDGGQGIGWSLVSHADQFDCLPGDELSMVIYQSTQNTHLNNALGENRFCGTQISQGNPS